MYDWVEARLMREALPNEHLALFAPGMLALGATTAKRRRSASSTSRERALARARELVDGHGRDWYRTVWNQISDAPRVDGVGVHADLRNSSQDNLTHWLISTQVSHPHGPRRGRER